MMKTDPPSADSQERRDRRRYPLATEAVLTVRGPNDAIEQIEVNCVNLAAGGICVRSSRSIPAGQRGTIRLPPGIRRRVEVVRCTRLEQDSIPDRAGRNGSGNAAGGGAYELGLKFLA